MTDQPNVDPAVDPALQPGGDPPADPPQPDPQPEPAPRMVSQETFVREITPLRGRLRETETELETARRQLRESQELIARLQRPADPNAPPAPTPPQPRQPQQHDMVPAGEIERAAAELNFRRDAQTISETGYQTFGQAWVDSVNLLNGLGVNSGDFVGSVMEVAGRERTHEIMHAIAQEPEKAAALAGMSPARRIAEITRISEKMNAKAAPVADPPKPAGEQPKPAVPSVPTKGSRAPAPAPAITPSAKKELPLYDDSLSDEEFTQQFNERAERRRARR